MDQSAELLETARAVAPERLRPPEQADDGARAGDIQGVEAPTLASLTVCTVGLSPTDQSEFERLVAGGASLSPRLIKLDAAAHAAADVILIDGTDSHARDWWRSHRGVLHRRPMVWMGQRSPYEAHTTLVRPVMWSLMPIILYRAAQVAPERRALAIRTLDAQSQAFVVIASRRTAAAQLRWMLETVGYRSTISARAREGLAALHAAPYAGLILAPDSTGPTLDIPDICKRVRQSERRVGRLPVLVLDPHLSPWQRWRASFAGHVEFADWPGHALQLKALLKKLPPAVPAAPRQHSAT